MLTETSGYRWKWAITGNKSFIIYYHFSYSIQGEGRVPLGADRGIYIEANIIKTLPEEHKPTLQGPLLF